MSERDRGYSCSNARNIYVRAIAWQAVKGSSAEAVQTRQRGDIAFRRVEVAAETAGHKQCLGAAACQKVGLDSPSTSARPRT